MTWNPHHVTYTKGVNPVVVANHRTGTQNTAHAYNGTDSNHFYQTPSEFYTHPIGVRGVLDKQGLMHKMSPSGLVTKTPHIEGVGSVRLRYPIVPEHVEGNVIYKEIDAIKDLLLRMSDNIGYYEDKVPGVQSTEECVRSDAVYQTST